MKRKNGKEMRGKEVGSKAERNGEKSKKLNGKG